MSRKRTHSQGDTEREDSPPPGPPRSIMKVHDDRDDEDSPPPGPLRALQVQNNEEERDAREGKQREDGDDEREVGPPRPPLEAEKKKAKKVKKLKFEQLYLDALPSAEMYERSYMHRDVVTHIAVSKETNFIITGSCDGHIKFWKKLPIGMEFVRHFRAHLAPVLSLAVSFNGFFACSAGADKTLKVFDVITFDMINIIVVPFTPSVVEWIYTGTSKPLIAIGSVESPEIYLFNSDTKAEGVGLSQAQTPIRVLSLHQSPVKHIKYNEPFNAVISIDDKGFIEYWSASKAGDLTESIENVGELPEGTVDFEYKLDTSLFEFVKNKTVPTSLSISQNGELFVCMGKDRQVYVFRFKTGKLYRKFDESLQFFNDLQKDESSPYKLDTIDFGRRLAVERDIDKASYSVSSSVSSSSASGSASSTAASAYLPPSNVIFDESGNFIFYPTLLGVKLVNLVTNRLVRVIGQVENTERFLGIALYQGKALGVIGTTERKHDAENDPTLFCCAFKKHRFYMFTKREPRDPEEEAVSSLTAVGRDVFNEKPTAEERVAPVQTNKNAVGQTATIHTTMGDIVIKLFPAECPRTVENFVTHAKNGYYSGLIFHRVIKGFMIQTGDPLGDGTGGDSIWGGEFEDEFNRSLRHDRPFVLSMANHGPNTNGSQFFITTVPLPRLDNIHTVFGRVVKGMEVVLAIEKVKTDKNDKPLQDVKMVTVKIQ